MIAVAQKQGSRLPVAVLAVAATLLLVSAWLSVRHLDSENAADRVRHAVRAQGHAADAVLSDLTEAETGQRGFMLTGEPGYLAPYTAARASIDANMARLAGLLASDPQQTTHLGRLQNLASAKLEELGKTLQLSQAGQTGAAMALLRSGSGRVLMQAARMQVSTIHAIGDAQLARAIGAGASPPWIWPIGAAGFAALLLGGLAQRWLTRRQTAARRAAETSRLGSLFGLTQSLLRDVDGRITFWSPGMEALYGYTAAMAVGRLGHELLATRFPVPRARIEAELETNGAWSGELVHRCRDGTSKTVVSHLVCLTDASAGERSVVEMNFDITALRQAETHLRLALDASGLGTWTWELCEDGPRHWDARVFELYGLPQGSMPSSEGRRSLVVPEDLLLADRLFARLIDPADAMDQDAFEFRIYHPSGQVRWLAACRRAEFAEDPKSRAGRSVLRIVGTLCDITAAKELVLERERNAALLRNILETAPGPIYAKNLDGKFLVANAAALSLIGKPWTEVEGRTDLEVLEDPGQAEKLMATDRAVMASGIARETEELLSGADGQARAWVSAKTPMRAADGRIIGMVGVSVEITERKRADIRRELMIHELNHRVKNTLATVQAVASETLQGAPPALRAALEGRLLALASVHDILTRESWHGAELGEVVAAALAPFGGAEVRRFRVCGPHILLLPRAAVVLAMGLHELATNATKYGALHVPPGWVSLTWDIQLPHPAHLLLTWAEHDGPVVAEPAQRGFGTNMIEGALACDLDGDVTVHFDPQGVRCIIRASLDEVAAPAEDFVLPSVGTFRNPRRSGSIGKESAREESEEIPKEV